MSAKLYENILLAGADNEIYCTVVTVEDYDKLYEWSERAALFLEQDAVYDPAGVCDSSGRCIPPEVCCKCKAKRLTNHWKEVR